jgi:hypothetical protein
MTDAEALKIIAMAVTERNEGWHGQTLREEHEQCDRVVVRMALMKILHWLEYLGRRDRREPLRVEGPTQLLALGWVLQSNGDISRMFELEGATLDWRAEIPDSARTAAIGYVRDHLKINMHIYRDPRSDPHYRP